MRHLAGKVLFLDVVVVIKVPHNSLSLICLIRFSVLVNSLWLQTFKKITVPIINNHQGIKTRNLFIFHKLVQSQNKKKKRPPSKSYTSLPVNNGQHFFNLEALLIRYSKEISSLYCKVFPTYLSFDIVYFGFYIILRPHPNYFIQVSPMFSFSCFFMVSYFDGKILICLH